MKRWDGLWTRLAGVAIAAGWTMGLAAAQTVPVPNPSFEEGNGAAANWSLSGGEGAWQEAEGASGQRAIVVTGTGEDSNFWRSEALPLEPSSLYRLRFRARNFGGEGGTPTSGPSFANRDLGLIPERWELYTSYFATPREITPGDAWLRFGQWRRKGSIAFDDVELLKAQAVHRRVDGLVLGRGERIRGNEYRFDAPFHALTNYSRPLDSLRCYFNTNRFTFAPGSDVVYRHALEGRRQTAASLDVSVANRLGGVLVVEASLDGATWRELGRRAEDGQQTFDLPADLFPADSVWIRLRGEADPSGGDLAASVLNLEAYAYRATVDGPPLDATGATDFVAIRNVDPRFAVTIESLGEGPADAGRTLRVNVANATGAPLTVPYSMTTAIGGVESGSLTGEASVPVEPTTLALDYRVTGGTGLADVRLVAGGETGYQAEWAMWLPILCAAHYGERLPASSDAVGLWWASSGWKISRNRVLPEDAGDALVIKAARNEAEAAQLVVRPAAELKGLTAQPAGPLTGPDGAVIPAENIDILRVGYVNIQHPTDATGEEGLWPDPLPRLTAPIDVPAGTNQPLWVRVRVPGGIPGGAYTGSIALAGEGYAAEAPIRVEVFDFDLPSRMTCVTAFGFSPHTVFDYHKLTDPAQQREVIDKYLAEFGAHHITPYDPAPLDDFKVTWPQTDDPAQLVPTIDWTAWDAAMGRAFDVYGFNSFKLPSRGLGGGTFHSRVEPELNGFKEGTPQYQAAFNNYWRAVQEHLREKGWLADSYVYWFDEPDPKDYEFVMNGFRKLKEAAPDIPRMLTEQVEPGLVGGPNIWCPIAPEYIHDDAEARRVEGEKFWWYLCTAPKAPYVTLFIDHAATELRVWLWQTWQRKVDGVLIWATNYWHSPEAYPDAKQNPYEDPMSWQTSYGLPVGTKRPWGNGDGRFVYPPEAAASGTQEGPVLEGPVVSQRFELLRDGIEDYEYMVILRNALAGKASLSPEQKAPYEALLQVPPAVTVDMTTFTTDPAPLEAHREAVARAIEAVNKIIP